MMATWFWILSVLVYFQGTTSTLVPVSLQYAPKCEGLGCHQPPQYKILQSQYLLQPQIHQGLQQQEYQHPLVIAQPYPKCPLGHSLESQQTYEAKDQQTVQNIQAQIEYQNQVQKQQQQKYQVSYQQINKNADQQKYEAIYQQLNEGSQQKDYQALYQQLSKALQQKEYEASYQNVNKGYLPPQILQQQQISKDIYQTAYQTSERESQNSISSSQIHQELSSNSNIQKEYESLRQQFNNAHLSSQLQQQQLLSSNVQQNQHVKTELSQEHQGKIKQTINYDIEHQQQGYNQHQAFQQQIYNQQQVYNQHQNVYNAAKSSTNIERHHPIHHHADDNSGDSEEIDIETGKKKKDHDAYYKFQYAVNDQHTGDIKSHKEERAGDEVKGEYSLVEKDGNVRTVKYFADWKTGFHATVHNSKPRN